MIQASLAGLGSQGSMSSRTFVYEVVFPSPKGVVRSPFLFTQSRIFLRVPQERMSTEMRRITQLGGKIVRITPLSPSPHLPFPPSPPTSLPWWVTIKTANPTCLYYFGPFDTDAEAATYQDGYREDLVGEGAKITCIKLEQCQPQNLTIEG